VEKVDDFTAKVTHAEPQPRFVLDYFWGQDRVARQSSRCRSTLQGRGGSGRFKFYDEAKGWPLGTGPYKLTRTEETVRVWDRRDDWWGAKTGVFKLPEPLRVVYPVHGTEEQRSARPGGRPVRLSRGRQPGAAARHEAKEPERALLVRRAALCLARPCARDLENQQPGAAVDDKEMPGAELLTDRERWCASRTRARPRSR